MDGKDQRGEADSSVDDSIDVTITVTELLLERHRTALARTVWSSTRDREVVQDVMQEALIQIWRHLPAYRPHGSFRAWMLKVAPDNARKHYRKKRVQTVPPEAAAEVSGNAEGPTETVERAEESQRLRRALGLLTTDHREVLILRYYNEFTVPEIEMVPACREGTDPNRVR